MKTLNFPSIPFKLVSIQTTGDGSCLYHAVLQAFNKSYINGNMMKRRNLVRELRNDLADVLDEKNPITGKDYYSELGRGEYQKFSEESQTTEFSRNNLKKKLRHAWGEYSILELLGEQLNIDIYVLSLREKDVYRTGDADIYIKGRRSVIILDMFEGHFETVGLLVGGNGEVKTFFDRDHELIRFLKERY